MKFPEKDLGTDHEDDHGKSEDNRGKLIFPENPHGQGSAEPFHVSS